MQKSFDQKIVIVKRPTRLQGLKRRYATVSQAAFLMEKAVEKETIRKTGSLAARAKAPSAISDYQKEDEIYHQSIEELQKDLDGILPIQLLDRELLPNYLFGPSDIVIAIGQDGLVANTAKYAVGLPIIGTNPDPERFDGILLPFKVPQVRDTVLRVLSGTAKKRQITLGEVILPNGQSLIAFNDFFIGCRTHVSARYRIEYANQSELHSSSGVLVSTGAGSTGWLSSVFNMARGLSTILKGSTGLAKPNLQWEDRKLMFVVREPFISRTSAANIVCGMIEAGNELIIESQMPSDGVIFSDGIESDFLEFTSGTIARIKAAAKQATLVV